MFGTKLLILCLSSLSLCCFAINLDQYQPLTSDMRSYNIGEPIVVYVVETTSAEASAGTGVEKSTDLSASVGNQTNKFTGDLGISGSDEGSGKTSRKGKVATQLSVKVTEVLPNGLLKIKGAQAITINGEKQSVTVSGLIRVRDISKSNSIFSYQISDAVVEISGDGDLGSAQKRNVFYKFFNWLGLL